MSGRHADYVAFCQAIREERGFRCECCGRTAAEARQEKLHVHHLWPVASSGVADTLATSRVNVILVCNWCHKLQHPGYRRYLWDVASQQRSRALHR
jgi:predicted HNH restriction endonuclease